MTKLKKESNIRPKKSLGQHFLIATSISQRIVCLLHPDKTDNILEIGPGPGALTAFLEDIAPNRLLLLEKDYFWAVERAKNKGGNTLVVLIDALNFPWSRLCASGSWKLVGNLPYNVASPLIWDIVAQCPCFSRAVFMVQKEVGQRLAALPGSRAYGALSVWVQSYAKAALEFTVAPGSFRPPPKVDSAVVSLVPLPVRPLYPDALAAIVKLCFQQRRKQLGGIFKRAGLTRLTAVLDNLQISPQARPEDLSPMQFQAIACAYTSGMSS